ncbi:TetR/AcrR family transcriptional regulator [Pseudomonas fontis]|uniref:TetR/AcrR family transcriptional regulator n=1 Tax=Pseudomonas fontis TaxID=2942633 RepID=A0ABT5NLN2_9PSED|nr:TetR/AcrR family transcriptional regulator [Pseudomonas fontis]MDD0975991.1 TetR/AcrR family transcriptional regulator [Pseudomonas fontis]MDD0989144.1 TetR/AcrR family transcriptional regulator [Pseudomonas fontis]
MYIMPFDPHYPVPCRDTPPAPPDDSLRGMILQAAGDAFASEGYSATTIQSIAARAGLPKSNVLYHFKSKESIYAQVLEGIAVPYLDACTPFHADEEPLDAMVRKVKAMIRLFQQRPSASKVLMVELANEAPRLPTAYFERWTAQAQQSVACLGKWMERGLLAPVDPHYLLLTLGAIAQSCISLGWQLPGISNSAGPLDVDFDAAATTATRLLLRGIIPDGA